MKTDRWLSEREGAGEGEFAHNRFLLRVCEFSEGDEGFGALSGLWRPPDERYRHHWSEHRRDRGYQGVSPLIKKIAELISP